ncbi:DUF2778 domain-containing protein [Pantoea cypripedii]|uniref:Tlde1 domain-containing protein n=1 Tax=Pantoea cypripedii TaxID=55209 RepID=A0A6B9G5B8_PANCY|nr:DUF2778 domain-containing protein [Pantoea cypripedii]QGY32032.1 hypothetical protein CUN67_23830 [Pantoea cypripedii]
MAINGKFILTGEKFSPLMLHGFGNFMAFSGDGVYRNRAACASIPERGPLPTGKYHIVKRPTGGHGTVLKTLALDLLTWWSSAPTIHAEWFALYREDQIMNDYTFIDNVRRGNFRLHPIGPAGISLGCITLQYRSDFLYIRQLLTTYTYGNQKVPGTNLESYGVIEVIDGVSQDVCLQPKKRH